MEHPVQDGLHQTDKDRAPEALRLKRRLGLWHGVALIVGLVIGGGIFISPKGVVQHAGSSGLTLVLWAIGGLLTLLGALTFGEMGVAIPVSGEKYAYLEEFFGPFVAFLYLWLVQFFLRAGSNAIKALMFAAYLIKPFFPDCAIPTSAVMLLATVKTVFLTALNCKNVEFSMGGQNVMTGFSLLTLMLVSATGLFWIFQGNTEYLEDSFKGSTSDAGDLTLAIYSTLFTYSGSTALNFLIEELKNPARNLPLAIAISILLTTVLYVFVNLAYLVVIGVDGVLASEAVAVSVTFKSLGSVAWVVPIMIALTACSSANAAIVCGSRIAFVGARKGHLPSILGFINIKFVTPVAAVLFQGVLGVIFIWTVEVYTLINNLVCALLVFDLLCVIGYIRFRVQHREALKNRLFKLPFVVPIAYLILSIALVGVPLATSPTRSFIGIALTVGTAAPYYAIVILWFKRMKRTWLHRKLERFSMLLQKLLYCAPEDISNVSAIEPTKL